MATATSLLAWFIFTLPALALVLAIAMTTPSWRWALGIMATVGGVLAYFWYLHWRATLQPGYEEGRFGVALFAMMTQSFATAVAAYIVGATWWYRRG